ncbi:MAG: VIT1/CCC1 transporter family protein, partial [Nitrospinae bacterium]|nr:VIT1/CCC1 transporter family protein [Nitrospinota bacterium]
LPYLLLPVHTALPVSIAGTLLTLFTVGGCKGRLVKRRWWRSGLEMLAIAGLTALVGFLIGHIAGLVVR